MRAAIWNIAHGPDACANGRTRCASAGSNAAAGAPASRTVGNSIAGGRSPDNSVRRPGTRRNICIQPDDLGDASQSLPANPVDGPAVFAGYHRFASESFHIVALHARLQ